VVCGCVQKIGRKECVPTVAGIVWVSSVGLGLGVRVRVRVRVRVGFSGGFGVCEREKLCPGV